MEVQTISRIRQVLVEVTVLVVLLEYMAAVVVDY